MMRFEISRPDVEANIAIHFWSNQKGVLTDMISPILSREDLTIHLLIYFRKIIIECTIRLARF